MKRQRSGSSAWFHRNIVLKSVATVVFSLILPVCAFSQSSSVQPNDTNNPGQSRIPAVPERFALPNVPILPSDIGKVSRRIRAATDYLFGKVQPSNMDVFRKGPHHRISREAQALRVLKTWLEQAGCVSRADIPLLSDSQPSAFALLTTSPGQIPLTVDFQLIGQQSKTMEYTIWLAPGPGLERVDVTWENSSPR